MARNDALLEKMTGLEKLFRAYSTGTTEELKKIGSKMERIHEKVIELDKKVDKQNGRVSRLEENQRDDHRLLGEVATAQSACPGTSLRKEFTGYKQEMKPIYVAITSWKTILLMVVVFASLLSVLMVYLPEALSWLWDQLSGVSSIFGIDF